MGIAQFKSALGMPLYANDPTVGGAFIGLHQPAIWRCGCARNKDRGNTSAIHALVVEGIDSKGIFPNNLLEAALWRHDDIMIGCRSLGRTMTIKVLDHSATSCNI